jgi:rhodanese-related sulfurtransferase
MKTLLNDPKKGHEYFRAKVDYTTGPIELDHMLEARNPNIVIVDVRDRADYLKGHVPCAINLPREKWTTWVGLRKDKLNIIYCYTHTCHLAYTAAVEFTAHGYPCMVLEGGFEVWKACKLDVDKGEYEPLRKAA